ncbi:MAG: HD domain-containing protein [Clostridia bacterium]|nr:HD domain-containing protein [Clostridia bacterium]
MKKFKPYDVLKSKKINYNELSNEIKYEVAILGGLDIFTDAHVRGVTNITTKICEELNMDYTRLKHIVLGAYLHDVGKIMVPNEVLQKSGKLTDEEYEIIKTHTTHGYDICMKYKELREYAPVARWHHESFDGSGYPDKLVGNQIPFEASVVKVADVYDALTRKRQYKEGFKKSQAIDIMLGDAKKDKMSSKILVHLIEYLLSELYEEITTCKKNVQEFKNNIQIMHDIEKIYKQIYDNGYTPKLVKKLKKYELAPGYDMSINANLLTVKQKALEKEEERLQFLISEEHKLQAQYDEAYTYAKKENWYPNEPYYR